jgi:hypothetical protein
VEYQYTISPSSLDTTGVLIIESSHFVSLYVAPKPNVPKVSMSMLAEEGTKGSLWYVTGLRCDRVSVSLAVGSPD